MQNSFQQYFTPSSVATHLARWAPRGSHRILDPAVGDGALVKPFLLKRCLSEVVLLDIDGARIRDLRFRPATGRVVKKQLDYLNRKAYEKVVGARTFDCIVVNPPFKGNAAYWSDFPELDREAPSEGLFVLNAIQSLRDGGRLLAILPSNIVSGDRCRWIREYLFKVGHVLYVHKLARKTFSGVEGSFYLFVFEKGKFGNVIRIENHSIDDNARIDIAKDDLHENLNLDFDYVLSSKNLMALKGKSKNWGWKKLSDVAFIDRGASEPSRGVIHTTSFRDGKWGGGSVVIRSSDRGQRYDILVGRVGRDCIKKAGLCQRVGLGKISNCVFRIRTKAKGDIRPHELLFAFRLLTGNAMFKGMYLRGAGASYVGLKELKNMLIPTNLSERFARYASKHKVQLEKLDLRGMEKVEEEFRNRFMKF